MKQVTVTELRRNIFNLLEEVLDTGIPLEIDKGGRRLRIAPVEPVDKFANFEPIPNLLKGDPEDIVHIEWDFNIDLP